MRCATILALTLICASGLAAAATRNVPSASYPTIQSAVNASNPGDTVNVAAGVYTENVLITTNNLTVQGFCYSSAFAIVDGTNDDVFHVEASNVTLKCLTLRNGYRGVHAPLAPAISLQNLRVLSSSADGIRIEDGNGFRILATEVRGAEGDGVHVASGNNGLIQATTVRNVSLACFYLGASSDTVLSGNTALQCGSDFSDKKKESSCSYAIEIYGDRNQAVLNSVTNACAGIYTRGTANSITRNTLTSAAWGDSAIVWIGDDATVDDNKVTQSFYNALLGFGERSRVRRNVLNNVFDDDCGEFYGSDLLLANNTCRDSNSGFNVYGGERARVEGNVVERNGFTAFGIYSDDSKVLNNRATFPGSYDAFFILCEGTACEVRGNQVTGQAHHPYFPTGSFYLILASGTPVSGNSAVDGSGFGFYLACDGCTLTSNVAIGNGVLGSGAPGFYVQGTGNGLSFNQSQENQGPGYIFVGSGNVATQSSAIKNLQEGYWIASGSDNRLQQCTVTGNGAEGIDNDGTATDVLSNVSNFNRRDCTNDVTLDQNAGNSCFDGSNFNEGSQVDN